VRAPLRVVFAVLDTGEYARVARGALLGHQAAGSDSCEGEQ
jgi:hypothetical protein